MAWWKPFVHSDSDLVRVAAYGALAAVPHPSVVTWIQCESRNESEPLVLVSVHFALAHHGVRSSVAVLAAFLSSRYRYQVQIRAANSLWYLAYVLSRADKAFVLDYARQVLDTEATPRARSVRLALDALVTDFGGAVKGKR
ncbi:MAG: hypothetical protein NXI31_04220 [bacterium]|nr:hypothetical protein [bacterium]